MSKKVITLVLMLVILVSAFAFAEEAAMNVVELGTSGITVELTPDYVGGTITDADTSDSQIAYFYSEENLVDFDVYQWAKAEGETLESIAIEEAAEFGAEVTLTGSEELPMYLYETVEVSEDVEYPTATFLMENGDVILELVFWLDGDDQEAIDDTVSSIVDSLKVIKAAEMTAEGTEIILGTSSLKVTTPTLYKKGQITAEDTDDNQVAYYYSDDDLVDFDVYQWAKAEGETLAGVAAEEAALFDAELIDTEFNGIPAVYYCAVESYDGVEYPTATFIMENGSDFVELVFWMDGDEQDASDTVEAIVDSLVEVE